MVNLDGMEAKKGYIPWVGQVKRKRASGNQDSCRRMLVGYVSMFWSISAYIFMVIGVEVPM
jgi:hypothetical protein